MPRPTAPADLDDAAMDAVGADLGDAEMTRLVTAVIAGNSAALGKELGRLGEAGVSPIPWLRQPRQAPDRARGDARRYRSRRRGRRSPQTASCLLPGRSGDDARATRLVACDADARAGSRSRRRTRDHGERQCRDRPRRSRGGRDGPCNRTPRLNAWALDRLARQSLAHHVELIERRIADRQRSTVCAMADLDAKPEQIGQLALQRRDIGIGRSRVPTASPCFDAVASRFAPASRSREPTGPARPPPRPTPRHHARQAARVHAPSATCHRTRAPARWRAVRAIAADLRRDCAIYGRSLPAFLSMAEFPRKLLICLRFLDRVEVLALDILNQRDLKRSRIVEVANDDRDLVQRARAARPPAALSRHDLIIMTMRPHDDRLDQPTRRDRCSEFVEQIIVEMTPRLIGCGDIALTDSMRTPGGDDVPAVTGASLAISPSSALSPRPNPGRPRLPSVMPQPPLLSSAVRSIPARAPYTPPIPNNDGHR